VDRKKGIIMMLLSALFFALMAAIVKDMPEYPLTQKMFFRNFLGFIFAFIMVKKTKGSLKGNNRKLLLLRSILGMFGVGAYFYSIQYLNLADAVIINKFAPFFVVILSAFILKEKIGKGQIIALFMAIIGAVFVTKPTLNVTVIPALIGLMAAMFAGMAYVTVSYLRKTDRPETIVFYFTLVTSLFMMPFAFGGNWILPRDMDILKALGLGVFSTAGQILMTYGYRYADASEVSIYSYSDIIYSMIIGFLIFSEIPDYLTLTGGAIIILAGFINFYTKRLVKAKENSSYNKI
jgi:drug/metabolite transporter (DMT)-like permease